MVVHQYFLDIMIGLVVTSFTNEISFPSGLSPWRSVRDGAAALLRLSRWLLPGEERPDRVLQVRVSEMLLLLFQSYCSR